MAHAYAYFVAVVALQRVVELVVSRRRMSEVPVDERLPPAEGRGGYALLVLVHAALLIAPVVEHEWARREPPAVLVVASAVVFAAAQVLRVLAIRALGRRWNVRAVVAPDAGLVDTGPYRWIRHPNYAAVLLEFSALPLLGGAWISWIALNLVHAPILAQRVRAEERALRRVPGWIERMEHKPRFLPRLERRREQSSA